MSSTPGIQKDRRNEALSRRLVFACLTLLFALLTPLKTLSQPLAQVNAEECLMACCKPALSCCCEVSPAKPLVPSDLTGATSSAASVKFLVVKNSGKLPAVPHFDKTVKALGSTVAPGYAADFRSKLPIYLMVRSLLI